MDQKTKNIRMQLRAMAPVDAIAWIRRFQLPEDQERVLIDHECRNRSLQQIAEGMSLTADTVKTYRRKALRRIVNSLEL